MDSIIVLCRFCSHENPDSARFCNSCGGVLPGSSGGVQTVLDPDRPPTHEAPRAGMVVDERYRLVREIGRGAFGVVFEAEELGAEGRVAIKFLNVFLMVAGVEGQQMRARFAREWTAGSKLSHPRILRMLHVGESRGVPYIVMELVAGETLAQMLARRGALPLSEGIGMVGDILDALDHAHAMGVIHRDVKPSNVIIEAESRARLMDFGIAKVMETFSGSLMTQTGLLGTPSYMSPEQASGAKIDHRSDLFSVGLVAHEVFTGRRAFEGHPAAIISQILTKPLPSAPQLPLGLQQWLARACVRDAAGRFGSAREMREALVTVAQRLESLAALETVASAEAIAVPVELVPVGALARQGEGWLRVAVREDKLPDGVRVVIHAQADGLPPPLARVARGLKWAVLVIVFAVAATGIVWLLPDGGVAPPVVRRLPIPPRPVPAPAGVGLPPAARAAAKEAAREARAAVLETRSELVSAFDETRRAYWERRARAHELMIAHYRERQQAGEVAPGLTGFQMREVLLAATWQANLERQAIILGPDGRTTVVTEGDKLQNGWIHTIGTDHVLMRPFTYDPLKLSAESEIVTCVPGLGTAGWGADPVADLPWPEAARGRDPAPGPSLGELHVESTPPGADLYLDNSPVGRTPLSLTITTRQPHSLVLELEGYRQYLQQEYYLLGAEERLSVPLSPEQAEGR